MGIDCVIIVDNDEISIFLEKRILESKKIEVVASKNGKEGIKEIRRLINNNKKCLVLIESELFDMDIYEFMREFKSIKNNSIAEVAVLTVDILRNKDDICKIGISKIISKPLTIEKLTPIL